MAEKEKGFRILALKLEFDWKNDASKALYRRLRELGWQAAHYFNHQAIARYAQDQGWRRAEAVDDPESLSKKSRKADKGELSGAAYSAIERELHGAFQRDHAQIYWGKPVPQRRPQAALVVRGHKDKSSSGIRIEMENDQYVAYLGAQAATCEGGCWLRLPIARNTRRDEYQSPLLNDMISWKVPIAKAALQVKPHGVILRLSYKFHRDLPEMGDRTATLGPVIEDRLILRAESGHLKDYSSKLAEVRSKKDAWELIRRRVMRQIGWRHGHARLKRKRLASLSWDDWLHSYLHGWTREIVEWLGAQGVGTIRLQSLNDGDWPADKFKKLLEYKAADAGIQVAEGADLAEASGERAATAAINRRSKKVRKRRQAERELQYQLGQDSETEGEGQGTAEGVRDRQPEPEEGAA